MHPMSVLVIAKKKAAGPGGYFDPMESAPMMAQGPMAFELAEDEPTDEKPSMEPKVKGGMPKASGTYQEIIASLKEAAQKLEAMGAPADKVEVEEEEEEEEEGEAEEMEAKEPEAKPAPKAKRPAPTFLKKKVMAY
jgi:hypothetical protein